MSRSRNLQSWKSGQFQKLSSPTPYLQWELATDHGFLNKGIISKFYFSGFLIFVLVFVSRDFELGTNLVAKSQPSVPHGANLFILIYEN